MALAAVIAASKSAPLASAPLAARGETEPSTERGKASANFSLTVNLTGARNDKGRLAVALFDSAADFPDQERALRGRLLPIRRGEAAVTFHGLTPGVYAIAVLHDENSNSRMDFNFLGMPLEGYGFSNDAPVTFGPPSFEEAAFKLVARHSRSSVRLRYFLR